MRYGPPLTMLVLAMLGGEPAAAKSSPSPWHADHPVPQAPRFDLPDETSAASNRHFGSSIIAGRQLTANAVIGFGRFGPKVDHGPLAPATARDLAVPRPRKAAIGFSLRF